MDFRFIITGAPGCGKSSILKEIAKSGYEVVHEPARQILEEQRLINGDGVYDKNSWLFKELILSRSILNYNQHANSISPVLFDRGIPDVVAYSDCFNLQRGAEVKASQTHRYNELVFYMPPWEAIYENDEERTLSFAETKGFGDNIKTIYSELGYTIMNVPYISIKERALFILDKINKL